jgi:hypothetical protein
MSEPVMSTNEMSPIIFDPYVNPQDTNPLKFVLCAHSCAQTNGSFRLNNFGLKVDDRREGIPVKIIFDSPANCKSYTNRGTTKEVLDLMKYNGEKMYEVLKEYNSKNFPDNERQEGKDCINSDMTYAVCKNHIITFDSRRYTKCGFGLWKLGENDPLSDMPNNEWQPGATISLYDFINYYAPEYPNGNNPTSVTIYLFICRGSDEEFSHCERGSVSFKANGNATQEFKYESDSQDFNSQSDTEPNMLLNRCMMLSSTPTSKCRKRTKHRKSDRQSYRQSDRQSDRQSRRSNQYGGTKRKSRRIKKSKHTKKLKYLKKLNGILRRKK